MKSRPKFSWLTAAFLALLHTLSTGSASAQFSNSPSFGGLFGHKSVQLKRKLPPILNVNGKTVGVAVAGANRDSTSTELQSAIENLLTRGDSGVRVEANSPDLLINCQISAYSAPKVTPATQNTLGSIDGALTVAFRISQPRSNTIITSGVATSEIDENPEGGGFHFTSQKSISTTDVQNELVADTSRQIAGYLVTTDENVTILLAGGGALNPPQKLALSNLWSRALEGFETMTPYSDPRLDAYRIYDVGAANEALAYQAQDAKAAIKYLQEASIDYGKALSNRPDEKYFLDPQNRIKTALAHYTPTTNPVPAATMTPPADAGMTNDDVIALVAAKMDEANILDNIQSATKVSFDLSINGQVKLTRSGVNGRILSAMKAKMKNAAASPPAR